MEVSQVVKLPDQQHVELALMVTENFSLYIQHASHPAWIFQLVRHNQNWHAYHHQTVIFVLTEKSIPLGQLLQKLRHFPFCFGILVSSFVPANGSTRLPITGLLRLKIGVLENGLRIMLEKSLISKMAHLPSTEALRLTVSLMAFDSYKIASAVSLSGSFCF